MIKILSIPGLLLVGALTFLTAPGGGIAASECGGEGRELCWENESCINIFFYKQCTRTYKYWEGL